MLDRINRSMSPTSQSYALSSMSQLGHFANHGGPHASMHYPPLPPSTSAEDFMKLKKEVSIRSYLTHTSIATPEASRVR